MRRAFVVAAALCLTLPGVPALAAPAMEHDHGEPTPVFAVRTGELARPESVVAFDTLADDYTTTADGQVLVGFLLAAAEESSLDPGVIHVRTRDGRNVSGPHRPEAPGQASSFTIATLSPGSGYDVTLRSQRGTTGAYQLSAFLAGDANSDFQVNQDDLVAIDALAGTAYGDPTYSPWADADRNGKINAADRQVAGKNLGAATRLRLDVANPLDEPLPADALTLDGLSPQGFNAVSAPAAFALAGAEFHDDPAEAKLTVNGHAVPADRISLTPSRVTTSGALVNGRNTIAFTGVDSIGRPLYHTTTVWAGVNNLRVDVVDQTGAPVTDEVTVRVSLTDDQDVHTETTTSTGRATFANVPSRTVLVKATASGNRLGTVGLHAGQGSVRVTLLSFGQASSIANNDFSQGAAGWDIGSAPVSIAPHVEGIPGSAGVSAQAAPDETRAEEPPMAPAKAEESDGTPDALAIVDNDLTLSTTVEGEQAISRTFTTEPEVTAIRIRYRFITSEVPGGYFGSQYNDYFRVALRSQQGGGANAEANSMNGLGLGEFHYGSGATGWRDLTLPVDQDGDTIQVDLGVANVGDGAYDSQVVVDFVEEVRDQISPTLAWNNTQGGLDLTYTVENGELEQAGRIDVYWANGPGHANRLGAPVFSHEVPAGTAEGSHGPVRIAGNLLAGDPAGVTHLVATSSPSRVGAVADVRVNFGPNANAGAVRAATIDIIKDSQRAAGQAAVTISSTARTPADQARAMFQNLTNAARPIATNVQNQLDLYAAAGDAVVNVFVAQTQGLNRQQILANGGAIRAAMEQEINNQGPQNVSRHCADPNVVNVADIGAGAFTAAGGALFVNAIRPRVTRFLDERASNNCYHIEVQ
ncbi:hypothetical protein [Micromonospora sagamiensis]|uniref:Uncharacterized protein n=2 Tax=Micromonospora sagamiensis TaxID=47875 RepID=A0A562WEU8_9ACTN|nr:hypothetical protein [Micromonospora sagamiensis]TWJ28698.1 hypothetical protein JD81_02203 [Micromonospora sagamiensis]BCL12396.1 hypothetical protein GCM10017556_01350 [Micromonospora sagamiensis]